MRRAALGVVVICVLAEDLFRIDPVLSSMSAQVRPFRPSARPAVVARSRAPRLYRERHPWPSADGMGLVDG
jgi:hypothetical protein